MWNKLGSPPDHLRYYKYSDHSAEQERLYRDINLEQNRTTLFVNRNDQHLSNIPQESLVKTYGQAISQETNKPLSSLKSTTKINNSTRKQRSTFDLNLKSKASNLKKQPKSMFQSSSKKNSAKNLSQKNQSQVIREQRSSIFTNSSKINKSDQKNQKEQDSFLISVNNQEEQESFSRIMVNQINKTESSRKIIEQADHIKPNYLYEMVMTLRELRDISKENLLANKKLIKLIEDKNQVSFLYDRDDKSQIKFSKAKKQERKSFKKTTQKSTVKKLGKSVLLEQRVAKVEQKVKFLTKKVEQDSFNKKLSALSKTKKKSMSALR